MDTNAVILQNYASAIRSLVAKLARQIQAVQATEGQISGFKALLEQLDSKAPKK